MLEEHAIPVDLVSCHQLLRELFEANRRLQQIYEELLATCTNIQESHLQLEQEKEELEQTIKELMHRLYGRRSERSNGQWFIILIFIIISILSGRNRRRRMILGGGHRRGGIWLGGGGFGGGRRGGGGGFSGGGGSFGGGGAGGRW